MNSSGRVRDGATPSCCLNCLVSLTNQVIIMGGGLICLPLRQQHLLISHQDNYSLIVK